MASLRIPKVEQGAGQVPAAPSSRAAAWIIATREISEQIASLRFLVIAALVIGLTPLAAYVGVGDYRIRLQEYERLAARQDRMTEGPERKRVSHFANDDLLILRVLRPPEPLSVLVRGMDNSIPQYWDFSETGLVAGPLPSGPHRIADMFGHLDLEFLIRVALGLLAILLAFDAIVGEKELGTLRAVLSQPVARRAVLAGKLGAGFVILVIPLLICFAVALVSTRLFSVDLIAPVLLGKVALLFIGACLYLFCFYSLGLLVSSLVLSQKTSLVVLLVIWIVAVLAVPPLATLIAQAASPVPPMHAIEARRRAADDEIRTRAEIEMGDVYRRHTGLPLGSVYHERYLEHREAIDSEALPIHVRYLNERRRLVSVIDGDAERRAHRQNQVARIVMSISPAAVFAGAASDLTETGDAAFAAWLEAAHRHQDDLDAALFEDPPVILIRNGPAFTGIPRRPAPSLDDLPHFSPPRRDLRTAAIRALPSLGILVLFTLGLVGASLAAFSRYDVR